MLQLARSFRLYTAIFIVPGFIMAQIIDSICPRTKSEYGYHIIRCLYLSLTTFATGCWILLLLEKSVDSLSRLLYSVILTVSMLLYSIVLAVLIGCFKRKQIWRRILWRLRIYSSHSIPYAWEYAFFTETSSYVYITLIDGAQIYGLYASNSFSSSEPDDRDVYLEKVYDVKEENGTTIIVERHNTKGMLIRGSQISSIEFLL